MSEITHLPTIEQMIDVARNLVWTDEMKREHVIRFAWTNVNLHNPEITREMVEKEYDKLFPRQGGTDGV